MASESSTPAVADAAYAGSSDPGLRNIRPAAARVTAEETSRPVISGATPLPEGAWCGKTSCRAMAAPAPMAGSSAVRDPCAVGSVSGPDRQEDTDGRTRSGTCAYPLAGMSRR